MINLYQDQQEIVNSTRQAVAAGHKAVLLQSTTGSGKSVMASSLIQSANAKGNSAAFLVPRRDLLQQMANTFRDFDIDYSYVAAGEFYDKYSQNHLCSMQTLVNRLGDINPNILFVDETHYGEGQLTKIIEYFKQRGVIVIGLSATPWKMSGKGLGCYYDHMVEGKSVRWLIDNGRLSDYRLFGVSSPDLSQIKIVNGDYSPKQLREKMEADRVLIGDAVQHYKDHAYGKLNLVFCTSIKHSKMTAQAFNDAGIPAAHMDAETPKHIRRQIIRDFALRKIWVLTSVDLMCFGFDLASQVRDLQLDVTVEAMSDMRPTRSLSLQMQKWGRVLRMKDQPALIFDHANNHKAHGIPCLERQWSLMDRVKKKRDTADEEMAERYKRCTVCFMAHNPAPKCPNCGFVYPKVERSELLEVDAKLVEIRKKNDARILQKRAEQLCETLEDWEKLAEEKGHKEGWAAVRHKIKQKKKAEEKAAKYNDDQMAMF